MPDELKTDAEKSENPCSDTMDVEDRDGNAGTSKNKKEEGEQEKAEEQEDFDDADNEIDLPHNLRNDAPPELLSLQQSRRVFRGNRRRRGNGFRTLRNLIGRNPP